MVLTEKRGEINTITLSVNYGETYNLKYDGREELKTLSRAPTPYKLIFLSAGEDSSNKKIIDIKLGN